MATEIDELILFWMDYLTSQGTIFANPLREKVRRTIRLLEELKALRKGE